MRRLSSLSSMLGVVSPSSREPSVSITPRSAASSSLSPAEILAESRLVSSSGGASSSASLPFLPRAPLPPTTDDDAPPALSASLRRVSQRTSDGSSSRRTRTLATRTTRCMPRSSKSSMASRDSSSFHSLASGLLTPSLPQSVGSTPCVSSHASSTVSLSKAPAPTVSRPHTLADPPAVTLRLGIFMLASSLNCASRIACLSSALSSFA
mmetsp:Transcript_511/g.1664  ORF Transcript_511/g.1664 Transcript_511/m.1664 type:complete len:209 (-) Transcript_511:52-678(-)